MSRRSLIATMVLFVLLTLAPALAAAQGSTSALSFQGELADSGGNPVSGSYNMRFAIYDGGGNRVWPPSAGYEQHDAVGIEDGLFNVLLGGRGQPLNASHFAGGDRYLQIWVCQAPGAGCNAYEALQPRQPILAVAYALLAQTLAPGARIVSPESYYGLTVESGRSSDFAAAIYGHATSSSGKTAGLFGTTDSGADGAMGVWGMAGRGDGSSYGVLGQTGSTDPQSAGVKGTAAAGYGVVGETSSIADNAAAGHFEALGRSGITYGVYGRINSDAGNASGVYGESVRGATNGVMGESSSSADNAAGVFGWASAGDGRTYGVYGRDDSPEGSGVFGEARALSGKTTGVHGQTWSDSSEASGVYGLAIKPTGQTYGVQGATNSGSAAASGVHGRALAGSGIVYGVHGQTNSHTDKAAGVYGTASATDGKVAGVYGRADSRVGYGGYFENTASGALPGPAIGVYGKANGPNSFGVYSDGDLWVQGNAQLSGQLEGNSSDGAFCMGGCEEPGYPSRVLSVEVGATKGITAAVTISNESEGTGLKSVIWATRDLCPPGPDGCLRPIAAVQGLSLGTVGSAGYFEQSELNSNAPALHVRNDGTGWTGFFTSWNDGVYVSTPEGKSGLEVAGGTKSAVVSTSEGPRRLYTEEATEVWFSDYGFGRLQAGQATIRIDPLFAETVSLDQPYHVFVQPYGDAELYVTARTATSFEVHLRSGDASVEFSYRIVAKRRGYEAARLEVSARPGGPSQQPLDTSGTAVRAP